MLANEDDDEDTQLGIFTNACFICFFLKKWAVLGLFILFSSFIFNHKFYRKTVDISGIRTRIVGAESKHADHLTTTTALTTIKEAGVGPFLKKFCFK